jgi:hypothetical protein
MRLNTARGTAIKMSDTECGNTMEKRIMEIFL